MHDSSIVSRSFGSSTFHTVFRDGKGALIYLWRLIKIVTRNFYKLSKYFSKREKKLKAGLPLDKLHFHYFTYDKFIKELNDLGEIDESLLIPGTNSIFISLNVN